MKKIALVSVVLIGFGLYVLALRYRGGDNSRAIAPNPTISSNNTTTTSPSTSSTAASTPPPTSSSTTTASGYKDGTYTGPSVDAYYGNVQVQVTISGGKITDVTFLDYPHDRNTSVMINSQAMPYLKQEAIQAQSANVSGVSGASATSYGFEQSLSAALSQAS